MQHPIPRGTKDVLPDEMRELRSITDSLRTVFEQAGYGEVYTPTLEYESVMALGELGEGVSGTRFLDEQGSALVLRPDMTLPIARLAATRYQETDLPLRLCYLAHAYRGDSAHHRQPREFLHAGVELIGGAAPEGTAEALTLLCEALNSAGLDSYRIGLGDASLYLSLLDRLEVPAAVREKLIYELTTRDFVGLERELAAADLPADQVSALLKLPQIRGAGGQVFSQTFDGPIKESLAGLEAVYGLIDSAVRERVIFDLGLSRGLGYYTGAIFEIYDPSLGVPLGGGGRYDELLAKFGRPAPAVGFAIYVERLHAALTGRELHR